MTIIVGVKCTDGIVIGADSIATSAAGSTPIMRIESNDKIKIFAEKVIVATTGSVGYSQRLHFHIDQAIAGGVFKNLKRNERVTNISKRFLTDLNGSNAHFSAQNGIGFGALLASEIDGEPCLIEYSADTFQPEFKQSKLFFVSMGSGQVLADPFLAFVARVLWKNTLPDVKLGKFGLYWALTHTINTAPGYVGHPIRMAVLNKNGNQWVARESADDQEATEFIANIEGRIGAAFSDTPVDAAPEIPQVPTLAN